MNQVLLNSHKQPNNWWKRLWQTTNHSVGKKLFNSLWSIFLGLFIAALVIWNKGVNPYFFVKSLIVASYQQLPNFTVSIAIFSLAATAVGISFKSGLFNIGVSGQMMGAGIVAMLYLLGVNSANFGHLIVSLILAICTAALIGALIGWLKAYLNLHEVLSSILLNWIIYYLGKYAFGGESPYTNFTKEASQIVSTTVPDFNNFFLINNSYWFWLTIISIIIIIVGITFSSKMTIGYKINITGLNPDASAYAGVNQKYLMVGVMGFGGCLSGIAGWIFYLILNNGVYNIAGGPIQAGFDAIAISLLAYNNPFAIIFASAFYSSLEPGFTFLQLSNVPLSFQKIISGIITYFSALSLLFTKFQPLKSLRQYCRLLTKPDYLKHCYSYYAKRWIIWWKYSFQIIIFSRKKSMMQLTNSRIKELKIQLNTHFNWKHVAKLNDQEKLLYFQEKNQHKQFILQQLDWLGWKRNINYRNNYLKQVQYLKQEHQLIKNNYAIQKQLKKTQIDHLAKEVS